jgi:predicted RNase H-like HicB family nuclease
MTTYIGLLRKEKCSDYGVDFPDFPGCITAGRTHDEACRMAAEALACWRSRYQVCRPDREQQ